jgi:hypothetical protein
MPGMYPIISRRDDQPCHSARPEGNIFPKQRKYFFPETPFAVPALIHINEFEGL